MNLLLMSNSTNAGGAYLGHAWEIIHETLAGSREVLFVPFALADHDAYTRKASEAFSAQGITVGGLHESDDPIGALAAAPAIFVGGGNTFRLLRSLQQRGLLAALQAFAHSGRPYLGASAGTNIAAPSIRTTNDMPIVFPEGFGALSLVPFQINCHYVDPDPHSNHAGETRELRLQEYLEENSVPVLAMREGVWLRQDPSGARIGGRAVNPDRGPALIFRRGSGPTEIAAGDTVGELFQRG